MKTCHNCACDPVCDHNRNGWETCGNWIQKPGEPPTNADRIRAMSDQELAVFLESSRGCPSDDDCEYGVHATPKNCIKHWTTWLQQPAEEEP